MSWEAKSRCHCESTDGNNNNVLKKEVAAKPIVVQALHIAAVIIFFLVLFPLLVFGNKLKRAGDVAALEQRSEGGESVGEKRKSNSECYIIVITFFIFFLFVVGFG